MSPRVRKYSRIALGLAVSLGLLLWLAQHIDFSASLALLYNLPAGAVLGSMLLVFISSIISSLRFWMMVTPHYPLGWRESAGLNLLTVLSTHGFGALSDGLRVHYLTRLGASLRQAVDLTLADRLLSLWLFSVATLLLMPCVFRDWPIAYAGSGLCLLLLLAGTWTCSKPVWPGWLQPCLDKFVGSIASPRKIILQITGTLICCATLAGAFLLLSDALGLILTVPVALALAPAAVLVSSIPFTYAGLGTREAAFVFGLPLVTSLMPEQAVALSLVFAAVFLVANIPGILFLPRLAVK